MLFIFWLVLNIIFLFSSLYFYLLYFASGVSLLNIYSCFVFLKIVIFTQWTKQFISSCVMIADEFEFIYTVFVPSLLAQMVQCLPTMQETWIRSLVGENPLEKETATHSSSLAWKTPWMEECGRLQTWGPIESDMTKRLHFHFHTVFNFFFFFNSSNFILFLNFT